MSLLALHLAAGILLGAVYFHFLWWNVRRFAAGSPVTGTIALIVGRVALLGATLGLASLEGARPLLTMALGLLIGRAVVMSRFRQEAR